jgi:hypothetical protein
MPAAWLLLPDIVCLWPRGGAARRRRLPPPRAAAAAANARPASEAAARTRDALTKSSSCHVAALST